VIFIKQSFRHYPFISKDGNIILKYADLSWFLAWLIKNKILNHFWICRLFCRLAFFYFADLLLHFLNMQTFVHFLNMQTWTFLFCRVFADLLFIFADFLQTFLKTCFFYFCRLVVAFFWICRLFCRLAFFADLFFYDFWIGF